jgi:hypothetical protein
MPTAPEPVVGLRTPEALAFTGLTYRQLDHWTRTGLIHAAAEPGGSGKPRQWPFDEMDVARLAAHLIAAGFNTSAAIYIARQGIGGASIELAPGIVLKIDKRYRTAD